MDKQKKVSVARFREMVASDDLSDEQIRKVTADFERLAEIVLDIAIEQKKRGRPISDLLK